MGREMTYKMLVRAINSETGEELAQLVSESFTVCSSLTVLASNPASCLKRNFACFTAADACSSGSAAAAAQL